MIAGDKYLDLSRLCSIPFYEIIIFMAMKIVFDGIPCTNYYVSIVRYYDLLVRAMSVGECKYLLSFI